MSSMIATLEPKSINGSRDNQFLFSCALIAPFKNRSFNHSVSTWMIRRSFLMFNS